MFLYNWYPINCPSTKKTNHFKSLVIFFGGTQLVKQHSFKRTHQKLTGTARFFVPYAMAVGQFHRHFITWGQMWARRGFCSFELPAKVYSDGHYVSPLAIAHFQVEIPSESTQRTRGTSSLPCPYLKWGSFSTGGHKLRKMTCLGHCHFSGKRKWRPKTSACSKAWSRVSEKEEKLCESGALWSSPKWFCLCWKHSAGKSSKWRALVSRMKIWLYCLQSHWAPSHAHKTMLNLILCFYLSGCLYKCVLQGILCFCYVLCPTCVSLSKFALIVGRGLGSCRVQDSVAQWIISLSRMSWWEMPIAV